MPTGFEEVALMIGGTVLSRLVNRGLLNMDDGNYADSTDTLKQYLEILKKDFSKTVECIVEKEFDQQRLRELNGHIGVAVDYFARYMESKNPEDLFKARDVFIKDIHRIWKSEVTESLRGYSTKTPNIAVTLAFCINILNKIATFETLIFSFICMHDATSKTTIRNHIEFYIDSYKLINGILHNMMITLIASVLLNSVDSAIAEQDYQLKKILASPVGKLHAYAKYHNTQVDLDNASEAAAILYYCLEDTKTGLLDNIEPLQEFLDHTDELITHIIHNSRNVSAASAQNPGRQILPLAVISGLFFNAHSAAANRNTPASRSKPTNPAVPLWQRHSVFFSPAILERHPSRPLLPAQRYRMKAVNVETAKGFSPRAITAMQTGLRMLRRF